MGIVVWKKFPLVALVGWLAEEFATFSLQSCVIVLFLWLTRELACVYFVADILSLDLHSILLFY